MKSRIRNFVGAAFLILCLLASTQAGVAQEKADWQKDMDWAANDSGAPDCPQFYVTADLQACLAEGLATGNNRGNRECVMTLAINLAKTGDLRAEGIAYGYVLLTQCHNGREQQNLQRAGLDNVINYLRSF